MQVGSRVNRVREERELGRDGLKRLHGPCRDWFDRKEKRRRSQQQGG